MSDRGADLPAVTPPVADAVPHANDARVVVFTRPGCHLCEQALAVVAAGCAEVGADWSQIDIDAPGHTRLREMFSEQVPATFVDGRQHDFWLVDPQRLRRALTAG